MFKAMQQTPLLGIATLFRSRGRALLQLLCYDISSANLHNRVHPDRPPLYHEHRLGCIVPMCRAFAVMAEQAAGDTQGKMKRLSREMRNLRGKTALPVHMASSVFVRHDSDRMDKVRAMITGRAMPPGCCRAGQQTPLCSATPGWWGCGGEGRGDGSQAHQQSADLPPGAMSLADLLALVVSGLSNNPGRDLALSPKNLK